MPKRPIMPLDLIPEVGSLSCLGGYRTACICVILINTLKWEIWGEVVGCGTGCLGGS